MAEEAKKAAPDGKAPAAAAAGKKGQGRTIQAAARPQVTVYTLAGTATSRQTPMPDVMLAPIRQDVVQHVHTQLNKNKRQAYGVQVHEGPKGIVAGHQVSATSWGTGRAVARIPRVRGGGTHRAGQGAYGNMCRGGRMFAPTRIWRKWHKKVNVNQKRYAVCSAVAASAVPSLVMARGHRIQSVPEVPLVVEDDFESLTKTRAVLRSLQALQLGSDLARCKRRYKRAGKGKGRNRRWRHRVGPLIVYKDKDAPIVKAAANIRGVDTCCVSELNLLKLCPGGHLGRVIVWTEGAFRILTKIWGSQDKGSIRKKGYQMPRPLMTNSDLTRIINSQEIQSVLRAKRVVKKYEKKRNPLRRPRVMAKLNPAFAQQLADVKAKKRAKGVHMSTKTTTKYLTKPFRKAARVKPPKLTPEQRKEMSKYWDTIIGEKDMFKTRDLLAREREAVRRGLEAVEREKMGADLMDVDA